MNTWSSFDIKNISEVDVLNKILAALGTPTEGPNVIEIELSPSCFWRLVILVL